MSSDEEADTIGRSRRKPARNSSRLDALNALKEARQSGRVFRQKVDNLIPDLYVEMDENDYALKKNDDRAFVEDDDGTGYLDDSSEEEQEEIEKKKEKLKIDKKKKKGTIISMFQSAKNKKDESSVNLNEDEILNECLAGLSYDLETFAEENVSQYDYVVEDQIECDTSLKNPFKRSGSPILAPKPTKLSRNLNTYNKNDAKSSSISKTVFNAENNENFDLSLKKTEFVQNFSSQKIEKIKNSTEIEKKIGEELHSPPTIIDKKSTISNDDFQSDDFSMDDFLKDSEDAKDVVIEDSSICFNECPTSTSNENIVRFYYLDAFEDFAKHPGTVYLFGCIRSPGSSKFESCCVVIKNVMRQLFFLKRNEDFITDDQLRQEVQEILQRDFSISKFKSKIVSKKILSREISIVNKSTALEVWISTNFGRIPADLSGKTFSYVFNTTTTSMERLIVECGIKGPCWIEVLNAALVEVGVSHCRFEYEVNLEKTKSINVIKDSSKLLIPPIKVLSLNILTALNPIQNEQQIVMISFLYTENTLMERPQFDKKNLNSFCIVTKLNKGLSLPFDFVDKLKKRGIDRLVKVAMDERVLLNMFLSKFSQINPDMIIAHDWQSQLNILITRMKKYQLRDWHLISRLKRKIPLTKLGNTRFTQWELTAGRLCLDSKSSAEELVRSRSYEMEDLVEQVLKPSDPSISRLNLTLEQISDPFLSSSSKIDLINIIQWNWTEALFCLRLISQLNAIPLFLQITQIVGGIFSRTLMGGRAERNEFLLLHACFKNEYVPPDKYFAFKVQKSTKNNTFQKQNNNNNATQLNDDTSNILDEDEKPKDFAITTTIVNKKSHYTGGLVLEPKKGLYESFIVLLDFNSLYPSIIQEFNICFTTVDNAFAELNESDLPAMPGESKPDGILKKEIRELVNRRREVKNLMKKVDVKSVMYKQYNIRQMGLKLTANSMYGCLGFLQSRFYAKTLAAMITSKGREVLMHTRDLVQSEGFSVIYGDTDSIMVNTNSVDFENAKMVGQKLKQIVNKNYRLLELDIDGIYKKLLLLKKKKYAGLAVDLMNENIVTREMKGLDIVRRDWSVLAKEIGDSVVNLILSSIERDEVVEEILKLLSELRKNLDNRSLPLAKFEILKQLTKNPSEYNDVKSQPHVQVAVRLNETKKFFFKQGDVIKYIICDDGTNNPATQRAYHISEILNSPDSLSFDIIYYMSQQIHPVVSRLCEPIEEVDAVQIAKALGIDTSSFHRRMINTHTTNEEEMEFGLDQNFSACEGFTYKCIKCNKLNVIRSVVEYNNNQEEERFSLEKCSTCSAFLSEQLGSILKELLLTLRMQVQKNIQSSFYCDDITCSAECILPLPSQWTNEGCVCFKCHQGLMFKKNSAKQLFDQQCFFKTIFDLDTYLNTKCSKDKKNHYLSHPQLEPISNIYYKCLEIVDRFMALNDFNKIDLSVVLAPLFFSKLVVKN